MKLEEYIRLRSMCKKWEHPWANSLPQLQNRIAVIIGELKDLEKVVKSYLEYNLPVPQELVEMIICRKFYLLGLYRQFSIIEKIHTGQ